MNELTRITQAQISSRLRSVLGPSLGFIVALVVLVLFATHQLESRSQPTASNAIGIPADAAVSAARGYAPANAALISATSGQFSALTADQRVGSGTPIAPTASVWAVKFESSVEICPPPAASPLPCLSPRPGFTTVILDFATGTWLTTLTYSPP